MPYAHKNASLELTSGHMPYIRFGTGPRPLVMLPGLGDGLRSVKGTALPMAFAYRAFAKAFTVYAFSRITDLPPGYTTRNMARDQAEAMDRLEIVRADGIGISMGGMIAQHLAIDFPEKVGKLVLTVTASRPNPILTASIREWVSLAREGDHTGLMESNLRRIYSQDYYRKNKWLVPILGKLTKPRSYDRFFIQAEACRTHDACAHLCRIQSPTLVVGGGLDNTLGGEASLEIANRIPGARLQMYPSMGHGLYEEAGDFNRRILDFLESEGDWEEE